ncbi:hypothetical protein BESB_044150 [Besnoitia besnoiti]|uniref:Peptidylprolyl isomerase n=1 Tax=Besnoitia besnoiti TaxID=94643 RepID=A0A2A9MKL2_BESBE|nr:hypothetical protein BESB_044150 [Besnoitia besnoiti]PFH36223.1 hypothetical protein BESB_044150 [Besnoitia besnoiti]
MRIIRLLATLLLVYIAVDMSWAAPSPAVFPLLRDDDAPSGKITDLTSEEEEKEFSVRVLQPSSKQCGLRLNDWAEIRVRSFGTSLVKLRQIENKEFGHALQGFEVGKHNVIPLNRGIIGMCVGETRRVGIKIGNMGEIFYEVTLENFKRVHRKVPNKNDEL